MVNPISWSVRRVLTLFDRDPTALPRYRSDAAELAAVRAGAKPMATTWVYPGRIELALDDDSYRAFVRRAVELDLVVTTFVAHDPVPAIMVCATRAEELWRIPALRATHEPTSRRWSAAFEYQQSRLLGYPRAEAERWLDLADRDVGGLGLLVSGAQRAAIVASGGRALGTGCAEPVPVFYPVQPGLRLRPDALRRIPKGYALARVRTRSDAYDELFGTALPARAALRLITLAPARFPAFDRMLTSNFELLTARGWD
jgi:hypothetical protein